MESSDDPEPTCRIDLRVDHDHYRSLLAECRTLSLHQVDCLTCDGHTERLPAHQGESGAFVVLDEGRSAIYRVRNDPPSTMVLTANRSPKTKKIALKILREDAINHPHRRCPCPSCCDPTVWRARHRTGGPKGGGEKPRCSFTSCANHTQPSSPTLATVPGTTDTLRVTRPPRIPHGRSRRHAALRFTFDRARARAITEVRGATSSPRYRAAYERNGLAPVAQTTPMIGCRPGTSAASAIEGARHWFLSKGDHDWDQYPLADRIP